MSTDAEIVEITGSPTNVGLTLEAPKPREKRAFENPPPRPLFAVKSVGDSIGFPQPTSIAIKTTKQLLCDFEESSRECRTRGRAVAFVLKNSTGWRLGTLIVSVAAIATSLGSVFFMNLVCNDESRVLRVVGAATRNFFLATVQLLLLFPVLFQHYPLMTRSWRCLVATALMMLPWPIFYTVQWSMFPTKLDYFKSNRTNAQKVLTFFSDAITPWVAFLGPFELGRLHWKAHKRKTGQAASAKRGCFTQSLTMHLITYGAQALISFGVIMSAWGVISFQVSRAMSLLIAIPIGIVMVYSICHPEFSWNGGFAILFATVQFGACGLANLLPFVLSLSSGAVLVNVVLFFVFYCFYGLVFSSLQVIVSRMTQNNHAPQFLFIMQLFLDTFVGLSFVEQRTPTQFWTLLTLQSSWALYRNTGLFAFVYLRLKSKLLAMGNKQLHMNDQEMLDRDQFFFMLNMQSILSDVISSLAIPILVAFDASLVEPLGYCSISCVLSRPELVQFVKRYAILLSFRIVAGAISFFSYAAKYSHWASGRAGLHPSAVLSSAKVLIAAFHLHVWRNLPIFVLASIYLFIYVIYPVTSTHGFGPSSSSSGLWSSSALA